MATPQEPQTPQSPQQPPEEKLEFLRREEVRTMAKDTAKVREKESQTEQKRIADFKKEPLQPKVVLSQEPSHQEPKKDIARPTRRPRTQFEKLFVRLVIGSVLAFFVFNAVAFAFWFFFWRDKGAQQVPEPATQIQPPQVPAAPEPTPLPLLEPTPNPEPPIPFFAVETTQILDLEDSKELLEALDSFLENPPPNFAHIIPNLSLEDFFLATEISVPQELKSKLSDSFMLFSFSSKGRNRLGLALELSETENAKELLSAWEANLEKDTAAFFNIIGGKGTAYTPLFRSSSYLLTPVRFQTFSVIDFGIVYAIQDNKLILTSSFESMQRVIDKL